MENTIKSIKISRTGLQVSDDPRHEEEDHPTVLLSEEERDEKGNVLVKKLYSPEYGLEEEHTFIYNEAGQLAEQEIAYIESGMKEKRGLEYSSDPADLSEGADRIRIDKTYYEDGSFDKIVSSFHEKNVIRVEHYEADAVFQSEEFIYENDQLVEHQVLDENEEVHQHVVYTHTADGEIETIQQYFNEDLTSEVRYTYDDSNNLVEAKSFDAHGNESSSTMEYDENGNCIDEIHMNRMDGTNVKIERKYDAHNQVTEETYSQFDGSGGYTPAYSDTYEYGYHAAVVSE
ncbi:MAG: hypothetical protein GY754_34320 [bacterium]|nr:hypothetical protein [bacterium]